MTDLTHDERVALTFRSMIDRRADDPVEQQAAKDIIAALPPPGIREGRAAIADVLAINLATHSLAFWRAIDSVAREVMLREQRKQLYEVLAYLRITAADAKRLVYPTQH
jgi:hypothetical protein